MLDVPCQVGILYCMTRQDESLIAVWSEDLMQYGLRGKSNSSEIFVSCTRNRRDCCNLHGNTCTPEVAIS